ncbi:hypothetical protein RhiirA1_474719 [Rhizophagus irregularis]|uniref:Uncharacterized protein n=1 Tax=Rhizophagus irregularis TaxID=588596 RepID=A0A2N0QY58_9GLOM|nr:hypothetical protein RhiirA1_474719 [Rhizophagus irregularis]
MSNKKDLEKIDELLEQQNNESYEVLGSSQTVSSRGSSQAGSQQEPILILSNENITIKMEKSDTAVTSGISKKGKESAVTSATNEKYRVLKRPSKKNTNNDDKNSRKAISDKAKEKPSPIKFRRFK